MLKQYEALVRFCDDYDMLINEDKTIFTMINKKKGDIMSKGSKERFTIKHTNTYL